MAAIESIPEDVRACRGQSPARVERSAEEFVHNSLRTEGEAEGEGVSGDQPIVAADHLALLLEVRAQQTVRAIGRFCEAHDLDGAEDSIDLGGETRRSPFGSAKPQIGRDDDAGGQVHFADLPDAARHAIVRVSNQVRGCWYRAGSASRFDTAGERVQ